MFHKVGLQIWDFRVWLLDGFVWTTRHCPVNEEVDEDGGEQECIH